jgi:hypothetical protein
MGKHRMKTPALDLRTSPRGFPLSFACFFQPSFLRLPSTLPVYGAVLQLRRPKRFPTEIRGNLE